MRKLLLVIVLLFGQSGLALADQNDPRLERLFNQLAAVRFPPDAAPLVSQIDAIWEQSGSDTVDLLLSRSSSAVEAQDFDTAMQILNIVTEMRPNFAEAWFRRAELLLAMDSQQEAAADLVKVVRLEPRHFRAHALIGRLADFAGQLEAAQSAYSRALTLDPVFEPIIKRAGELKMLNKRKPPV